MAEHRIYTKDNREFYLAIPDYANSLQRISIQAPTDATEDTGIRLYSVQYNTSWSLQIRGFFQNRNFKKGKKWYYATASLGVVELRALRDACVTVLAGIE